MNDNYKKWNEIIGRMIGRNYNVECTGCRDDIIFNHNFINSTREIMFYRKYKNVKLINIILVCNISIFLNYSFKLLF